MTDIQIPENTNTAARTDPSLGLDPFSQMAQQEAVNPPVNKIIVTNGEVEVPGVPDGSIPATPDLGTLEVSGDSDLEADDPSLDEFNEGLRKAFEAESKSRAGESPVDPASTVDDTTGTNSAGGESAGIGSPVSEPGATPTPTPTPGQTPAPGSTPAVSEDDIASVIDNMGVPRAEAIQLLEWATNLTPEYIEYINQYPANSPTPSPSQTPYSLDSAATGFGTPAPVSPVAGAGDGFIAPVTNPAGQPGAPTTPIAPTAPDLSLLEEVVPGLSAYLGGLVQTTQTQAQQLQQFQQQQAYLAQQEAARQRAITDQQITVGADSFRAKYPHLSDADYNSILDRTVKLQILPGLANQNQGNLSLAMEQGLETALWSDPTYRAQVQQQSLNEFSQQAAQINQRREKAASLAGSGGGISRDIPPPDPRTMTREQKDKAMAELVAANMVNR